MGKQHATTPWSFDDWDGDFLAAKGNVIDVTDDENAEFIIRAVNSHDALLEALRNITDCYGVGYSDPAKFVAAVHDFMMAGRAAIKAAEASI